jgi:hypothetical protein
MQAAGQAPLLPSAAKYQATGGVKWADGQQVDRFEQPPNDHAVARDKNLH